MSPWLFVGGVAVTASSFARLSVFAAAVFLSAQLASAQTPRPLFAPQIALNQQENVPAAGQQAAIERAVKRFRVGVEGGIGLDPEMIMIGAHGSFGPFFHRNVSFRPGFEFGFGEVTTEFAVNLEVLFRMNDGAPRRWTPYFGVGPNFGLSHRGFEEETGEETTTTTTTSTGTTTTESTSRFDFGDTDFESGINFIVGVHRNDGLFLEMKATAYGVAVVRLLVGYDF
jgi:hypothetical protein